MSIWEKLLKYINSKEVGDTIKRRDIIYHIYGGPMPKRYQGSYGSTVDNYRRLLTRLGMLDHSGRGEYELKFHIREDLKLNQLAMLVVHGVKL